MITRQAETELNPRAAVLRVHSGSRATLVIDIVHRIKISRVNPPLTRTLAEGRIVKAVVGGVIADHFLHHWFEIYRESNCAKQRNDFGSKHHSVKNVYYYKKFRRIKKQRSYICSFY